MDFLTEAYDRKWFYRGALLVAALYGLGGVVHIGNMLGFGEMRWDHAPLSWKVSDVWWGALDITAIVGVAFKSPIGILAIVLAAVTQVIVYSAFPSMFALTDAHRATIKGLVYFNCAVLVVLGVGLYVATKNNA